MNIPEHLTTHEIKPSYQRIKIFEYLYNEKNHPTADVIYKNLVTKIPTLSKTTVYNTLKLFVDKGISSTLTIEDNEVRFDADTTSHGHFKCNNCHDIYDVEIDYSALKLDAINDFKVDETHIHLKGKCNKCLTKK